MTGRADRVPTSPMRSENEIFQYLAKLCQSPGYIHALAGLCFRDTAVGFADELKPEHLARLTNPTTLIRTELNTLYGLMMNGPIGFEVPSIEDFNSYMTKSDELLAELHEAINASAAIVFNPELLKAPGFNPFASATVLREPIFYAAESAYTFQYRDLAPRKYRHDAQWLWENRGLDLDAAHTVCRAVVELLNKKLFDTVRDLKGKPMETWTMLPGFTFSCAELGTATGLSIDLIKKAIEPFCVPNSQANAGFTSLQAFNSAYAYPIVKKGEDEYVLLQPAYGYSEALYDTPFYWMGADKAYTQTAMKHRGEFAEDFARDRLTRVFGASRVFQNVEILRGKGETLGEIDVLVVFGDRAIVLQAKSKKLTLAARNGNDLQLKGDFKAAVQDAVDQAYLCSILLDDPSITLRCRDGVGVQLSSPLTTVFPLAITTDHYPALAFQAKQLLTFKSTEKILPPLVMDVFALDAISEMLSTPLRFLSYIWLRAKSAGSFMGNHEHVLLSYHLQSNLWLEPNTDLVMLHDDIALPLDVAMAARRDNIPGAKTPPGLLTKFAGTKFEKIVTQIEAVADPAAISLGFALMELGEASIDAINRNLRIISRRAAKDRQLHDFSLGTDKPVSGVTFHVSVSEIEAAERRLYDHCRRRKYLEKAERWHGVLLDLDCTIRLVATLTGKWNEDQELEEAIKKTVSGPSARAVSARSKVGRNDDCPCGSGKKHKRCCLVAH